MSENVPMQGIRVLVRPGPALAVPTRARVGFDYPVTEQGSTPHFTVYYQTALGPQTGSAIATAVLDTCEGDYTSVSTWFGGLTVDHMNVVLASGIGGAYHYGCAGTDLYCDASGATAADLDHSRMLVVAEEVEVFSALQNSGWDCAASNGEGLSRVLATELYPAALNGFASAAQWLDTADRPDFVTNNDPSDTNYVSIGCSVLFLNYMRYQLGHSWNQIVQAGGSSLAATYQTLTGNTDAFAPFAALLQQHFPIGQPSRLTTDNPFPLTPRTLA